MTLFASRLLFAGIQKTSKHANGMGQIRFWHKDMIMFERRDWN
jgi:hypothetical protein